MPLLILLSKSRFGCSKLEPQSLDTITCLSVSKWVHVTGGDAKLKKLFAKVRELLVPGGYFILEPQPWKSYKTAINKLVRIFTLA